jgi:succinoglycan biosynthesis transport protein ExoP
MTERPRYASLRDYLGLLRRQRWLIVAATLVFAGAALALSLRATPTYEAEASVAFRDIAQDLRLLDSPVPSESSPAQLAAQNAEATTRIAVAKRVRRSLDLKVPVDALQSAVSARVATQTNLVLITGSWSTSGGAAGIANAFAKEATALAKEQVRGQLDSMIADLKSAGNVGELEQPPRSIAEAETEQLVARLQALREIVRPAEVQRKAEPPDAPSSPQTARNTLLGALVGLAIGLLAAFVRDSLDRRIRISRDAQQELGAPVVGRIGDNALGSTGLAFNGHRTLTAADQESFRMLRNNLTFFGGDQRLRSILVTSGLPEEGKSTVAAALASAAAAAGQRTLLVDADLRRPVLAERLGLTPSPGLAEYLLGVAEPREVLQTRRLELTGSGNGHPPARRGAAVVGPDLICIASGRPPDHPAELLASPRCREFFEKVREAYDLVVVDSSPLLASVDPQELVAQVDGVLVCIRVSQSTKDEVRSVRGVLARLPERPLGLVVTGLAAGEEEYGYYGYSQSGEPV